MSDAATNSAKEKDSIGLLQFKIKTTSAMEVKELFEKGSLKATNAVVGVPNQKTAREEQKPRCHSVRTNRR